MDASDWITLCGIVASSGLGVWGVWFGFANRKAVGDANQIAREALEFTKAARKAPKLRSTVWDETKENDPSPARTIAITNVGDGAANAVFIELFECAPLSADPYRMLRPPVIEPNGGRIKIRVVVLSPNALIKVTFVHPDSGMNEVDVFEIDPNRLGSSDLLIPPSHQ
ncbi:MAG: hypothetical protein WAS05_09200 [Candidatus Nanopelagicales bacterium]